MGAPQWRSDGVDAAALLPALAEFEELDAHVAQTEWGRTTKQPPGRSRARAGPRPARRGLPRARPRRPGRDRDRPRSPPRPRVRRRVRGQL